jgi:phosphoribosyl 1,2-cyclic phosphodiesterase
MNILPLRLWVLTSGSSGNCLLVWNGRGAVMVDCGLGPRSMAPYLEKAGLGWGDLGGVLLTHLHGDHVREPTLGRLMREGVPLHCHRRAARHLARRSNPLSAAVKPKLLRPFSEGMYRAGPFRVSAFEVPHDAPGGCFGYTIFARTAGGLRKISIATDIGEYDQALVRRFADSDVMVIESNYDEEMLEATDRPRWLKERIRQVHFSNDQCAGFVAEVLARSRRRPRIVVQAHVSRESNNAARAAGSLRDRLGHGHGVRLVETHHLRESELVTIE